MSHYITAVGTIAPRYDFTSPTEPRPITALSDQELRDLLHWPGQRDRNLLLTACANRKITHVPKELT